MGWHTVIIELQGIGSPLVISPDEVLGFLLKIFVMWIYIKRRVPHKKNRRKVFGLTIKTPMKQLFERLGSQVDIAHWICLILFLTKHLEFNCSVQFTVCVVLMQHIPSFRKVVSRGIIASGKWFHTPLSRPILFTELLLFYFYCVDLFACFSQGTSLTETPIFGFY